MIRLLLLSFFLAITTVSGAQDMSFPATLRQIDEAINESPQIVEAYERQLDETHQQYRAASSPDDKYRLAFKLYEQYKSFMNDSAVYYLEEAQLWAERQGKQALVGNCLALKAFQCSTVGYYNESLAFLRQINKQQLDSVGLRNYYQSQMHVYGELGYYTNIPSLKEEYFKLQRLYRDSLFSIIDHRDPIYLMYRVYQLQEQKRMEEARKLSDQWVKQLSPDSRDYAIACYYRSLSSDTDDDRKTWLAQSALSDVRHAVMDQASLLALADLLNADGDLDRSYRYIRFTWDCNNRFNTRMRSWQIAPILNVIEKNYQSAVDHNTKVLRMSITVVSILALLLLGVLLFLHRRNRQLDTARNELKASNSQRSIHNSPSRRRNSRNSTLNCQLSTLNFPRATSSRKSTSADS